MKRRTDICKLVLKELLSLNVYFKYYRKPIALGLFFVLLSNIAGVYIPVLVRQGLDEAVFASKLSAVLEGTGNAGSIAMVFGLLIIVASLIKGLFMYLMRQKIVVVSRHIEYDLKNDLYKHYQQLDVAFYRRNFTGDMMARIGEDVSNVRMYTGPAVMYFANILFVFITVIFQMVNVNAQMSLYILLPLPLLSFSIYRVSTIINNRTGEIQRQLSAITTYAQETFAGIRVLKSFGAEGFFEEGFERESKEYRARSLKLAKVNSLFFPLMLLLIGFSNLLVLYLGGLEVAKGNFSTGNMAEFLLYLNMLIWPVASLGWTTALVQKAAASQKRINEFLQTPAIQEAEDALPFQFEKELRFENVGFTYEGKQSPAVQHVNFVLRKGEILGITGPTGSGKSTLAHFIMRQYAPSKGSISFDTIDVNRMRRAAYSQAIAYVPQDVFLFSDTIYENIAFGAPNEVSAADVERAAAMACLLPDIQGFPAAMNTMLGERGVTLSGGQKQRLSLARALLRKADLYVLDDCLSAVDLETEKQIIANLKATLNGNTAIIISHRVAPLSFANEILVLDQGEIVEHGSMSALLHAKGAFAGLYERQAGEFGIPS